MLTARLLTTPLRQAIGPTACRALTHTDVQFPDYSPHLATAYFDQFPNYCQMIRDAKSRARRSILIDHCGVEFIDLKSEFKNVEHVYSIEKETKKGLSKLSLIEFKAEDDAELIARRARHNEGLLPVPLKVFQYAGKYSSRPEKQNLPFKVSNIRLSYKRELSHSLNSYSDLVTNNMMSLVALKMRFITLVNFERIFCSGMFEEFELMPFGSSVIDTGCDSGDLDLLLTRKEDHHQVILDSLTNSKRSYKPEVSSSLVHLDKSLYSVTRDSSGLRGAMKWFDQVLKDYMPLAEGSSVLLLPHAKVPIIKFTSRITSIECDLSFHLGLDHRDRDIFTTTYSGILMSQIMYSLCRQNNLFAVVVIYLRTFAKLTGITSKIPGVGFTNFQFLSLVMFYLQQTTISKKSNKQDADKNELSLQLIESSNQKSTIPSFKSLLDVDRCYDDSTLNLNEEQLEQLTSQVLIGFFEYFSHFNFYDKSLNLYEAKVENKLDNSPVYVTNPLDRYRNICHNVNKKGLDCLIAQAKLAFKDCKHIGPLVLMKSLLAKNNLELGNKKARMLKKPDMQSLVNVRDINKILL